MNRVLCLPERFIYLIRSKLIRIHSIVCWYFAIGCIQWMRSRIEMIWFFRTHSFDQSAKWWTGIEFQFVTRELIGGSSSNVRWSSSTSLLARTRMTMGARVQRTHSHLSYNSICSLFSISHVFSSRKAHLIVPHNSHICHDIWCHHRMTSRSWMWQR